MLASLINVSQAKRLINVSTDNVIVSFYPPHPPVFINLLLRNAMCTQGIRIPQEFQTAFNNKSIVYLEDPEFQQAFESIYYPEKFNPTQYIWVNSSN